MQQVMKVMFEMEQKNYYVEFSWGELREPYSGCLNTGKGDIKISYSAHLDRVIIENIIGGDTFFGIPYRLRNI